MAAKDDWLALVDQEEGEALVLQLIQETIQRSQHVLFEKHIDVQVLPYAVDFAKETLISLVDYKFFRRDPGNVDMDLWEPDEEPSPAIIDSWARGAVPIRALASNAIRTQRKRVEDTKIEASAATVVSAARAAEPYKSGSINVGGSTNDASRKPVSSRGQATVSGNTKQVAVKSEKASTTTQSSLPSSPTKRDRLVRDTHARQQSKSENRLSTLHASSSVMGKRAGAMSVHGSVMAAGSSSSGSGGARLNSMPFGTSTTSASPLAARAAAAAAIAAAAAPFTVAAIPAPELVIQEENKRMLARIRNMQKDGGKVDVAYDHEGRVIMLNRFVPGKLMTQGVRAKVMTNESQQATGGSNTSGIGNSNAQGARGARARGDTSASGAQDTATTSNTRVSFRIRGTNNSGTPSTGAIGPTSPAGSGPTPTPPQADGKLPPRPAPRGTRPPQRGQDGQIQPQGTATQGATTQSQSQQNRESSGQTMLAEITQNIDTFVEDPSLDIPSLIDVMKMSPGVTLREGDSVRKGPMINRKGGQQKEGNKNQQGGAPSQNQPTPTPSTSTAATIMSTKGLSDALDPVLDTIVGAARPVVKSVAFPVSTHRQVDGIDSSVNTTQGAPTAASGDIAMPSGDRLNTDAGPPMANRS